MKGYQQLGRVAPEPERGTDWRASAACLAADPELFFLVAGANTYAGKAQLAEAKAVCAGCPSKAPCLTWALETGQGYGVWGGLSEDERRELRGLSHRQPKPAPKPKAARPDCGSQAGAARHRRNVEPVCPACRIEENRARRKREARRSGVPS